jgi:uncharacterized membrane protein
MSKSNQVLTKSEIKDVDAAWHRREEYQLAAETHPDLSADELTKIKEYRRKFMYKSRAKIEDMIYEWSKTNVISKKEHSLLCRYLYRGNFHP